MKIENIIDAWSKRLKETEGKSLLELMKEFFGCQTDKEMMDGYELREKKEELNEN